MNLLLIDFESNSGNSKIANINISDANEMLAIFDIKAGVSKALNVTHNDVHIDDVIDNLTPLNCLATYTELPLIVIGRPYVLAME